MEPTSNSQYAAALQVLDSPEKVRAAHVSGTLEKVYLLPAEFGGKDTAENIVYLPHGLGDLKRQIDGTVTELVRANKVNKYEARPEYTGKSFVPVRILIKAWHSDTSKAGSLNSVLEIWSPDFPHSMG